MGKLLKLVGDVAYRLNLDWLAETCYEAARRRGVLLEWPDRQEKK